MHVGAQRKHRGERPDAATGGVAPRRAAASARRTTAPARRTTAPTAGTTAPTGSPRAVVRDAVALRRVPTGTTPARAGRRSTSTKVGRIKLSPNAYQWIR